MATDIELGNYALSFIGVSERITALDESSVASSQCTLFLPLAKSFALIEFPWSFAKRYDSALTLEGGTLSVPFNDDWQFAYRLPATHLKVRRIVQGGRLRPDRDTDPIPFETMDNGTNRLLLTDWETPTVEYTHDVDPARYPSHFAVVVAWKLAEFIAPALAKDPAKTTDLAVKMYARSLRIAAAIHHNERQDEINAIDAEWIRGRG